MSFAGPTTQDATGHLVAFLGSSGSCQLALMNLAAGGGPARGFVKVPLFGFIRCFPRDSTAVVGLREEDHRAEVPCAPSCTSVTQGHSEDPMICLWEAEENPRPWQVHDD